MRVEERLFLNRIALRSGSVSPGNEKRAAAVVADLADSGLAIGNGTAMAAGKTAHPIVIQFFVKASIGFSDLLVENGAEGSGHLKAILRPRRMRLRPGSHVFTQTLLREGKGTVELQRELGFSSVASLARRSDNLRCFSSSKRWPMAGGGEHLIR
jgi:hypothetical protein